MQHFKLLLIARPARVIRILCTAMILLIIAGIVSSFLNYIMGHDYVYGFVPKFNLNREANVPTYFSSFILLFSSILLGLIANFKKKVGDIYALHWSVLSIIFLCLSIDESAGIHELLINPLRNSLHLSGMFYYSWIIIGALFVVFLAIFYFNFLFNLPRRMACQVVVAAFFYIGGTIGFEAVGGYYRSMIEQPDFTYSILVIFEESFEMIGCLIFIYALLNYISESIQCCLVVFPTEDNKGKHFNQS